MAELKTTPTDQNVEQFLQTIADPKKRQDSLAILELMKQVTGLEPQMWGASIIGFGRYHYRYASGREGDWFLTGFSPRKQNITVYIIAGFSRYDDLLGHLGKFKTGQSCLYLKKLEDIDLPTLRELVAESVAEMKKNNPA